MRRISIPNAGHESAPIETRLDMRRRTSLLAILLWLAALASWAQGFKAEPVFKVTLSPDREPVVAGEVLQLAAVVDG